MGVFESPCLFVGPKETGVSGSVGRLTCVWECLKCLPTDWSFQNVMVKTGSASLVSTVHAGWCWMWELPVNEGVLHVPRCDYFLVPTHGLKGNLLFVSAKKRRKALAAQPVTFGKWKKTIPTNYHESLQQPAYPVNKVHSDVVLYASLKYFSVPFCPVS